MALPTSIDSTTPAGSASPSLGDDQFRALKLAVEDILGIPDATSITQAAFDIDAGGLAQVIFYDPAVEPASGELGRNGSTLKFRIEDSRTATTIRPFAVAATTSGTPAASIGVGMLWQAESGDETPSDFGAVDFVASDVTAGSEDTYASILLRVAGRDLDEKYRFSSTAGSGFAALFTHAITADRTYTLPDATGTIGLLPASDFYSQVSGITTTSTSYTDATSHTITITTSGGKVLLNFSATTSNDTLNQNNFFTFAVDAVDQDAAVIARADAHVATSKQVVSMVQLVTGLAAGSHTFKVRWKVSANTGSLTYSQFAATEIL